MKFEYLIFNLIILAGPVALSFDRRVRFFRLWKTAFLASAITLVPFIIWDSMVTGRHWWFNEAYTMNSRILGLPPGEWLFFITVPFASLFVWEVLKAYFDHGIKKRFWIMYILPAFLIPAGGFIFSTGKEYTGLVIMVFGLVLLVDYLLGSRIILHSRTFVLLAIVTGLILIFNGYLTARPVVLYDPSYQLDFRITTIPVEDFIYGYAHILLTLTVFKRLRKGRYE